MPQCNFIYSLITLCPLGKNILTIEITVQSHITYLMQSQEYSNIKLKLVTWKVSVQWNLAGELPLPYCRNWNFAHYAVSKIINPQCIKVWSCLLLQMIEEKGWICFNVPICISVIWGGGLQGEGKMPLQNFFTKEQFFLFATEMKRGN